MALPNSITQAEFEKILVPELKKQNIDYNYISGKKHLNKVGTITLYQREIEGKDHVFILLNGMIYRFKLKNPPMFKVTETHSPCWKDAPSELNLDPVTLSFLSPSYIPVPQSNTAPVVIDPLEEANQKLSSLEYGDSGIFDSVDLDPVVKPVGKPFGIIKGKFYPTDSFKTGTSEGFDEFLEDRITRIRNTMMNKGREYRKGGNVYHNFDSAAKMNRQIPERALWGMFSKHIISLLDLVEAIEANELPSPELIQEKASDAVNYTLLLEGLMLRTLDQQKQAA